MSKITIKIIVDDKANSNLMKEHGFAVWIEAFGNRILFDTGQGKALLPNAAALGVDLGLTEIIVLSHGHYDHTGGVPNVIRLNPKVKVYYHYSALNTHFVIRNSSAPKDISVPQKVKLAILNLPATQRFQMTHPEMISLDIGLSGSIPYSNSLENTSGPFFLDPEGTHPDPLEDDMAMWIRRDHGLIIITGCCHSGLINTVNHVRRVSGQEKNISIIGGFHLRNASRERLEATAQALLEWDIQTIIPCHCTGDESITFLKQRLGEKVIEGYAGLEWKADQ